MKFSQLIQFSENGTKHSELTTQIKALIKKGVLKAESQVPTEEKLALELGVSKAITRQSYHTLIKEGWLKRIPKLGLVVISRKPSRTFSKRLQSIGEDMRAMGLTPSVKLLESEIVNNADLRLEHFESNETLLKVHRIILGDDMPLLVMLSYYSLDRFPSLEHLDLKRISFFKVLQEELNVSIYRITRHIRPEKMQKVYAEHLNVNVDSPCFRAISVTQNIKGQCLEYAITYGVGDRFLISL